MGSRSWWIGLVALGGASCTLVVSTHDLADSSEGNGADAGGPDALALRDVGETADARCDPSKPFGAPASLGGAINSSGADIVGRLSADRLTLYFASDRSGDYDIYVSSRASEDASWSNAEPVVELNTTAVDSDPHLSPDGRTLYFASRRNGGGSQIFAATRPSTSGPFGEPKVVLSSTSYLEPWIRGDEILVVSIPSSTGQGDLFRAVRGPTGEFGVPAPLVELNTPENEETPLLTSDGLTVYFASSRPGGPGGTDVYRATRPSLESPFGPPERLDELDSTEDDYPTWLSDDGCTMILERGRAIQNGYLADLFIVERPR